MQLDRILIHYAEIALKGRNRRDFERALRDNICQRYRAAGLDWTVRRGHDRIVVHIPKAHDPQSLDRALALLTEVPGIASFAAAAFFQGPPQGEDTELQRIRDEVLDRARAIQDPALSFAVRVNRADKRYPHKSDDLARDLGSRILDHTEWRRVDLNRPVQRFHVDIYPEGIYVYTDKRRGPGGLPVGSGGSVLALLSGGIDSPVAGYQMVRRGCRLDFLHLSASQMAQRDPASNPVAQLAARLSRYTLRSRMIMVPYTYFDMGLVGRAQSGYEMILFRRFVARVGERVAQRLGAQAMVAGDSLGQVASQTLENMVTSSDAAAMPVLRPLVGQDKQDIIDVARRIGTYEISIQPYKDCCALISQNPKTRSNAAAVRALEETLFPDYEQLIDSTLEDGIVLTFDCGTLRNVESLVPATPPRNAASGDA